MAKITEGRRAPDFTLPDAAGRRVSLADFQGQDVVVYFYPKDDTPGCTKESCAFRDQFSDFADAGAEVIGFHHSLRFVSQQAFAVALKGARVEEPVAEGETLAKKLLGAPAVPGIEGALELPPEVAAHVFVRVA